MEKDKGLRPEKPVSTAKDKKASTSGLAASDKETIPTDVAASSPQNGQNSSAKWRFSKDQLFFVIQNNKQQEIPLDPKEDEKKEKGQMAKNKQLVLYQEQTLEPPQFVSSSHFQVLSDIQEEDGDKEADGAIPHTWNLLLETKLESNSDEIIKQLQKNSKVGLEFEEGEENDHDKNSEGVEEISTESPNHIEKTTKKILLESLINDDLQIGLGNENDYTRGAVSDGEHEQKKRGRPKGPSKIHHTTEIRQSVRLQGDLFLNV
ncbi:OLC1v1016661C1 [Oldenlandia corymbosa var. corymbosa]|uniref:OLC1v1016661C1 n=1 Tax=Oldenlandia corymbosa var. corymbosa TaxID=529605 RepID=A0AAV1E7M0_OLDCO|nr:OLC1v1016661C1 [Oldenlandia corymbosa var. corymbosa]